MLIGVLELCGSLLILIEEGVVVLDGFLLEFFCVMLLLGCCILLIFWVV